MTLLHADSLWNLLWIIPLFLILLFLAASRYERTRKLLFPSLRAAASFLDVSPARRILRSVLLFLAVLFAVLAAAGPAWGRRVLPDAGPGRDLMILFDVSRSMLSDDVKPDRLSQGKWLVRELVRTHPADRFGLIAFAGNAFLLCPLTIDKTSFLQLSDSLDTDTIPLGGTNLQAALEAAVRAFEGAQGSHKAVVVVTDGDELTGNAAGVLKKLADAGIPLFVAGIGDPSNPSVIRIRKPDGSTSILTDSEGNTVRSPLNETLLASLAEKTRGIYVRSTAAEPGVEEIGRAIDRLDRRKAGDAGLSLTRPIERPGSLFALSLFFLLLYLCLSEVRKDVPAHRRSGGSAATAILLPFLMTAFLLCPETVISAENGPAPEPLPISENGPAETAESSGGKEKSPLAWFNTGVRAQKAQENELAEAAYEKAAAAGGDPAILAGSFQNLGILKHQEARKKFTEAGTSLKGQDLSGAEKAVEDSLARLADAESLYRESFRYAALNGSTGPVARNQQILLRERKNAEELKKKIEELKKLQEQARKQAEKALQDQQNQNQQKDQQDQQKQNQQKDQKQDQQQDQQKQGQQDPKQDQQQDQQKQGQQDQKKQDPKSSEGGRKEDAARQSAKEAADTAEKLGKKAEELSQKQLKDQAEKAGGEIRQAMDRQAEGKDREAEEHLKNAVRMLGGKDKGSDPDKQKDSGSDQQKDGSKDEKKDPGKDDKDPSGKQDEGDRKEPPENPRAPAPSPGKAGTPEKKQDRSIDPAQADAILNAMERDEKELRDMIKEMQKRTMPQREPKKNW